jgi:hypothetical protein
MEILSVSPLPASSILWQKGPASWVLTIVCKGTFDLVPGEATLAPDQDAPNDADDHWNDDPTRSLRAPADLVPLKVRADVLLVGSAFAPGGVPVRSLVARLMVGKIDKSIEAVADRVISREGSLQEGAGFARMPLVYERASGGPGTINPVGMRRDGRDAYGRLQLPNLQPPGLRVTGETAIEPVGFGPIASRWPQRAEKLGRHAASWSGDVRGRSLPGDIDLTYFNVAPLDQQLTALRDNERLVLENLHWEHARLVTALPGVRPCAFVEGRSGAPFRLPMHADTLWIDTDRGVCTVVWRRQLPLERPDEAGRVVVALEQPGQTLSWADVAPLVPAPEVIELNTLIPPPGAPDSEHTAAALRVPAAPLPFPAFDASRKSPQTMAFIPSEKSPRPGAALPFVSAPPQASGGPQWPVAAQPVAPPRPASEPDPLAYPMSIPLPPPSRPVAPPPVDSPWTSGAPSASGAPRSTVGAVAAASAVAPVARPEPVAAAPSPARVEVTEVLELLWFDGDSVPRIRRNKVWKPILTALEQEPADRDLDDPALAADAMEMEDRREVFEILARGAASDAGGIDRALDAAVRKDGKFVAQLALLSGQLEFLFDELETVKATVATVAPLVGPADEALKAAVEAAREFLKTADDLTPPSVAEAMTARIREAFAQAKRSLPETHLVEQTDRVLLSHRRYQKRIVFGASHLRCLVHLDGAVLPGYLPESLAKKLPMFQRFKGRLIAEVQQQADQYETHHASLRIVALARATPRRQER